MNKISDRCGECDDCGHWVEDYFIQDYTTSLGFWVYRSLCQECYEGRDREEE